MKKQNGFTVLEGLLIIVIVGILGFTGWFVWNIKQNVNKTNNQTANNALSTVIKSPDTTKYYDCLAKNQSTTPTAVLNSDNSCTVCIGGIKIVSPLECKKNGATIKMPGVYTPESILGYSKLPLSSRSSVESLAESTFKEYKPEDCKGGPASVTVESITDNSKLIKLELAASCGDSREALVFNHDADWLTVVGAGAPAQYQCEYLNNYKIPYSALYTAPGESKPSCLTKDGKSALVSY